MNLLRQELKDVLIACAIFLAFYLVSAWQTGALKREINTAVSEQCLSSNAAGIIGKYNDHVDTEISQQLTALALNTAAGNTAKATADAKYAQRLADDKIKLPASNCSVNFLK